MPTLDFAHRVFELAREGVTGEIEPLVEAGLPPNLTNDKGDGAARAVGVRPPG